MKTAFHDMSLRVRLALAFLFGLVALALFIPLWKADPNRFSTHASGQPQPPSWHHPLGTDEWGRGLWIRSIYGARVSLSVGVMSVSIALTVGVLLGMVAGLSPSWLDGLIMRMVDVLMAVPTLFLILIVQVVLTPSIWNVMAVIGLTSWMGVCRLVRAEVLSVRERPFIQAARARGFTEWRIAFRHILPHTLTPVFVAATLGVGHAILVESVLSFLGLGVQPPYASWGNMLENSLTYLFDAPWMTVVPGFFITMTVLSLHFVGDFLQARLQPWSTHA
ncbi:MAG: ABC transporter permease [Candidatus Margulisiibacteriota bacterium]